MSTKTEARQDIETGAIWTCAHCRLPVVEVQDPYSFVLDYHYKGDSGCFNHPLSGDEGTYGHVPDVAMGPVKPERAEDRKGQGMSTAITYENKKTYSSSEDYWQDQGANFMTPDVMEYIDTPSYWIELSEGTGFDNEPIYGVSVAKSSGVRDDEAHDLSQMFHSIGEATAHINAMVLR